MFNLLLQYHLLALNRLAVKDKCIDHHAQRIIDDSSLAQLGYRPRGNELCYNVDMNILIYSCSMYVYMYMYMYYVFMRDHAPCL